MSKFDELIQQLSPDGVEWKTLNDIGEFFGGLTGKSKNDFIDGNAAFITYSNIYSNPSLNLNIDEKVRIDDGEKQNVIQYGDILFTGSSETPEECGMSSVVTKEPTEKMYLNSFCFGLRLFELDKFNFDYLKHLFRSAEIRKEICKTANGVTRFNVSKKKMGEIAIPLPPLPVQEEIGRILDTFTSSISNLKEQIKERRKQHEYYRDQLLDFEGKENVEKKKILDLLSQSITDGPHETPELYESGIPFLSAEAIIDNKLDFNHARGFISEEYDAICSKKYKPQFNDVYMCKSGSTTGKVAINDTNVNFNIWSPLAALRVNNNNSARYLFYLLQTNKVQIQVKKNASHGSQPNLSMRKLEQFEIVVPNLSEQERIVNILDQFGTSITNLELQLKQREKQYEYYRNQLLDFKKKED